MTDNPPGWHPDPTGRHEHRYWDGSKWTDNVADQGNMSNDPVEAAPKAAAPIGPSMVNLPAIDPSILAGMQAKPAEPAAEPAPAASEPAPTAAQPPPAAAAPEPAAAPAAAAPAAVAVDDRPTSLALLLTIVAPGAGHQWLGVRREIGYGLLAATLLAIICSWFISYWIGLAIYVGALVFALYDLRDVFQPMASRGVEAVADVAAPLAWRVVGIGGVAMLVALVLPWYRVSFDVKVLGRSSSGSASGNAFDAFGAEKILWLIVGIAAVVLAAIHITQSSGARSSLPPIAPMILAGAAGLAWLLVIFRLLSAPGDIGAAESLDGFGGASVDVTTGRAIGALLEYAACITVAFGALAAWVSGQRQTT
jgi:uncharacterized protein DUF2510